MSLHLSVRSSHLGRLRIQLRGSLNGISSLLTCPHICHFCCHEVSETICNHGQKQWFGTLAQTILSVFSRQNEILQIACAEFRLVVYEVSDLFLQCSHCNYQFTSFAQTWFGVTGIPPGMYPSFIPCQDIHLEDG